MTSEELYELFFSSNMFVRWHWFRWHFEHLLRGDSHPFAEALIKAVLECEGVIPGYAQKFVAAVGDISGLEKHKPHYEQLLQRLSELHIIRQIVTYPWEDSLTFVHEPLTGASKKNPELLISSDDFSVAVEVKAPSLLKHSRQRGARPIQLPSRLPDDVRRNVMRGNKEATLPRDNPIKDFLYSADQKFSEFRRTDRNFRGLLVIVWDDFIYEPISSLLGPNCGLFTEKSFCRDDNDQPIQFANVDGIIILRHLHQLIRATRDEPFIDSCKGAFDYGRTGDFPPKVFIANPHGKGMSAPVVECLQAYTPSREMGAEYIPTDLIWWE